jgi:hypothetical protein
MTSKASKRDVERWETVDSYVGTYPSDGEDGAVDVEVQIGSVTLYTVTQCGVDGEIFEAREDAKAEADRLNAEADEESGEEIIGDGAASVSERTIWFIRTTDDGGGGDECDDTEYSSESEARDAAELYAEECHVGEAGEDAADYLRRQQEQLAGEPMADGDWCVYWETVLEDAGPRERYATAEQAEAAAALLNDELHRHNPGQLLCGFGVRELVDGDWIQVSS